MELIYLGLIIVLVFIITIVFSWLIMYKNVNKSLNKQNDYLVKVYKDLSNEFVEQFEKYNKESVRNNKVVEDYTKMYQGYLDLYNKK